MNKKLITLAVAAAMAAPMAAMADATMYGKLGVSIDYEKITGNNVLGDERRNDKYKGWGLNQAGALEGTGPSNRVGIKGSEDLGGGLKAIYQVEIGVTLSDRYGSINNGDRANGLNMRNSFVGLAGNWGTFLIGRHDTPLKISTGALDLFSDTMADYNATVGFQDVRADNAIAYISPSWSGFQLAAALVPGGGGYVTGSGNLDADSINQAWGLAAIYKNGPWYASAAYESIGSELGDNSLIVSTTSDGTGVIADPSMPDANGNFPVYDAAADGTMAMSTTTLTARNPDDWNKWRIGLGILDWNGFTLTGIYENISSNLFVNDDDVNQWQIQAGYAFGNNMVKAMYGQADRDNSVNTDNTLGENIDSLINDANRSTWAIAFDHNFSKRTKAYIVYTDVDDDGASFDDWNGFSLGMKHAF